jgi:hypothetical protein
VNPILTKCNEADTIKGGYYLIFSVLKRVKGRSLISLCNEGENKREEPI